MRNEIAEETIAEDQTEETEATESEETTETTEESGLATDESEETEGESKKEDVADDVEIVRESKSPLSDETKSVSRRIMKYRAEKQHEIVKTEEANTQLDISRKENEILKLALEQAKNQKPAPVIPNPDDFDEGVSDPGFIKKQTEHTGHLIQTQVAEQVARITQTTTQAATQTVQKDNLLSLQKAHIQRAREKCPRDHEDKEDAAIDILGTEITNDIIKNWDDSHLILYYLGANPNEAEALRDLIAENPVKGIAKVERTLTELTVRPKQKPKVSSPDNELPGGSSPSLKRRGPPGVIYE